MDELDAILDLDAQAEKREDAARQARYSEHQSDEDLRFVMGYAAGRRFVWELIGHTGLWRSSYTGKREDTDFREGQRNVGLRLWAHLKKACPSLALKMQEENE